VAGTLLTAVVGRAPGIPGQRLQMISHGSTAART